MRFCHFCGMIHVEYNIYNTYTNVWTDIYKLTNEATGVIIVQTVHQYARKQPPNLIFIWDKLSNTRSIPYTHESTITWIKVKSNQKYTHFQIRKRVLCTMYTCVYVYVIKCLYMCCCIGVNLVWNGKNWRIHLIVRVCELDHNNRKHHKIIRLYVYCNLNCIYTQWVSLTSKIPSKRIAHEAVCQSIKVNKNLSDVKFCSKINYWMNNLNWFCFLFIYVILCTLTLHHCIALEGQPKSMLNTRQL